MVPLIDDGDAAAFGNRRRAIVSLSCAYILVGRVVTLFDSYGPILFSQAGTCK